MELLRNFLIQLLFRLKGAFKIEESYFELCDEGPAGEIINTTELEGFPPCPHCVNQYGFSHCGCGKIMCTGNEEISECPWCENKSKFGIGEGSANINRRKG